MAVALGPVLVALVAGLAVVPAADAAPPRPPGAPVPVLDWQPCGSDLPGVDCATADVPLDYDNPRGPTIELALARRAASDPARRIGSVFVNPGGPGGSGVDLVLGGFGTELGDGLDGRFDVVGFDPRGIARSTPLRCFATEQQAAEFGADQPIFPYRRDQQRAYFAEYSSLWQQCARRGEPVLGHTSTADVARDLDLLRAAVGDERLTYLGFSYGSYLGTTYANLFPRRVRALVIDGVLNPILWSSGLQIQSDRTATAEVVDEFLRLCDEAGPACAFATDEGSPRRWERLADAVRARPVELRPGMFFTYDQLISQVTGAMYSPESWGGPTGLAAALDGLADLALQPALTGSTRDEVAATAAVAVDGLRTQLSPPTRGEDYEQTFGEGYFGNQCADTRYPGSLSSFSAIDRYAEAGSRFGPLWWWGNAGCAGWPVDRDRYTGPWSARTSAPVLVVGNTFDPSTDLDGARAVDRLLPNSRLLTYAGWGHTAYGRSDCATTATNRYLLDGTLPPTGLVCPANPNPLLTDAQSRASTRTPQVGMPPARPGGR